MELRVRQRGGIVVEYDGKGVMLDPSRNTHSYPTFVSHAHADHSSAFKHPERVKYATEETYSLLEAMGWRGLENHLKIKVGQTIKFDDIEVIAHNSGHVLGSVQFEINTPEGNVLYTGDLCTEETFTMKPASPVKCDLMIIESTFGAPMFNFKKREDLALEIYDWAVNTALSDMIPTFKTDSIGNAQEIISILNQYTKLPIVTSKSATKVTEIYRKYGYSLDSVDAKSQEGVELLDKGKCALITPKGSKPIRDNLDTALASGWASIFKSRFNGFALSDHADYKGLMGFIRKCSPKRVLTFHGGSMTKDFHKLIRKSLGIPAAPLSNRIETIQGPLMKNESRVQACSRQIVRTIRIPGFFYKPTWLAREMERQGFSKMETESSIDYLIERGVLKGTENGVCLS